MLGHSRAGTQHSHASTRVFSTRVLSTRVLSTRVLSTCVLSTRVLRTHSNALFPVCILVDMFVLIQIVDAFIGIGKMHWSEDKNEMS